MQGTVRVKKTFPTSFNTIPFGFNELWRNGTVPVCTENVIYQLGHIARSRADASKMAIASGIAICTADGLPPPAHFPRACSLAEVRLFKYNSSQFSTSLQSLYPRCSISRNGMKRNETKWNATQRNGLKTKRHNCPKRQQMTRFYKFRKRLFDMYCITNTHFAFTCKHVLQSRSERVRLPLRIHLPSPTNTFTSLHTLTLLMGKMHSLALNWMRKCICLHIQTCFATVVPQASSIRKNGKRIHAKFFCIINSDCISGKFLGLSPENYSWTLDISSFKHLVCRIRQAREVQPWLMGHGCGWTQGILCPPLSLSKGIPVCSMGIGLQLGYNIYSTGLWFWFPRRDAHCGMRP